MKKATYSKLIHNISSDYFETSSAMHRSSKIMVYVEGYEDVAFWRNIFEEFETPNRRFEITTPVRADLAKGKKVVLNFAPQAGRNLILCVDSDFDYLLGDYNDQSRLVNSSPYLVQTYGYAIENLLCYAPSLHSVAVKITKNDTDIFDCQEFLARYSEIIYPVFLWYYMAAKFNRPSIFTLTDFKNTVRLNYLDMEDNGESTLAWVKRQVDKRLAVMRSRFDKWADEIGNVDAQLKERGVVPKDTYLYMQGHALMDNVVKVMLDTVCDALRKNAINRIMNSSREGLPLKNELSYYTNTLRDIESAILDNTNYRKCPLFLKLHQSLNKILNEK